MKRRWFNRDFL